MESLKCSGIIQGIMKILINGLKKIGITQGIINKNIQVLLKE